MKISFMKDTALGTGDTAMKWKLKKNPLLHRYFWLRSKNIDKNYNKTYKHI